MEFYKRHVCRVDPFPDCVHRTFNGARRAPRRLHDMQGPNEFVITGTLKAWDITGRLAEIEVPTLITAGAHDEFTPVRRSRLTRASPAPSSSPSRTASHMQFVEEPERYLEVVAGFLDRVERRLGFRRAWRASTRRCST